MNMGEWHGRNEDVKDRRADVGLNFRRLTGDALKAPGSQAVVHVRPNITITHEGLSGAYAKVGHAVQGGEDGAAEGGGRNS